MENNTIFEDVRDKILEKLKSPKDLGLSEFVTLYEGFINLPLTQIEGEYMIGGPTIPAIMLFGKAGRIYFYAYRALGIKG